MGDEEKRRQYDLHGIVDDRAGQQHGNQGGFQTFNFGGFNFKVLFYMFLVFCYMGTLLLLYVHNFTCRGCLEIRNAHQLF